MNAASKTKDFYGRDFLVTKDTLIPRPETEFIVDEVKSLAGFSILPGVKPGKRVLKKNPTILDVGTGTGCIAISIYKEFEKAGENPQIFASDISEKALKVAQKNAESLSAPISFIISHLLEKVNFTPDIIVANLPYVDEAWDWLDKKSLEKEPSLALYAKDHGLALIKELLDTAKSEYLILEADPCQHQEIIDYAKTKNYRLLNIRGFILSFIKY